jgi:hypothetical protein
MTPTWLRSQEHHGERPQAADDVETTCWPDLRAMLNATVAEDIARER